MAHSPGDLRSAFTDCIELMEKGASPSKLKAEFRGRDVPLKRLCGLLWNCSDILPREVADFLSEVCEMRSRTYGAAVRALIRQV